MTPNPHLLDDYEPPPERIPLVGGDEYDALTGWRRVLRSKPGRWTAAKRSYNRRLRQVVSERLRGFSS